MPHIQRTDWHHDAPHPTNGLASRRSTSTQNSVNNSSSACDTIDDTQHATDIEPDNDGKSPQIWAVNIARIATELGTNLPNDGTTGVADGNDPTLGTEHRNGEEAEDAEEISSIRLKPDSKLGSPPHTPDQAPERGINVQWENIEFERLEWEQPLETIVRPKGDLNGWTARGTNQGTGVWNIKDEEQIQHQPLQVRHSRSAQHASTPWSVHAQPYRHAHSNSS